jgi:hypothetical protein
VPLERELERELEQLAWEQREQREQQEQGQLGLVE